jgi:hypothetical protein
MTTLVQTHFDQARKLTLDEREQQAELLFETLEPNPETDAAWAAEAHRRWKEHIESGAPTIDAFEAIDDARRRLKKPG